MKKYVLSIDQGTTSTRAVIFDKQGNLIEKDQREITLIYPHNGWVETDPLDIWISVVECINSLIIKANITFDEIDSIGITNQRESLIAFDSSTGLPIYNCIIWQSRQSTDICNRFKKYNDLIQSKTGLLINPYFSASKMLFILENVKGINKFIDNQTLRFCTIDAWILYKLTNGNSFKTDASNASRTMLYNIFENKYDEDLLELFNIKEWMLPKVCDNSCYFGKAEFFKAVTPITAMIGDQQGALFGQTCFEKGEFKNTYGTGCFTLANIGDRPTISNNGLLTTIAWKINGKSLYALEGSVFVGGAVVQWLRDQLNVINDAKETETLAYKVSYSRGVYFVPAFVGLGAPYWDDEVRGTIFGLTRNSNKNHIVRAALESIAYQSKDVIEVIKKEAGITSCSLKADGGATANKYLMQFQSDILRMDVSLSKHIETTALGAAYLAGLCTGFYKSLEDIKRIHQIKCIYKPTMTKKDIDELYSGWKKAVKIARKFK